MLAAQQTANACDHWLAAWKQVKELTTSAMASVADFDEAYPGLLYPLSEWSQDLEMELHNAGVSQPVYSEHRIRYAREYLTQFPEDDGDRHVAFCRAEGEALWQLGRTAKAEAINVLRPKKA